MKTKKGSCICNDVHFVIELDDNAETLNCHCIDCRKTTGGSFISVIEFKLGSLKIDKNKLDSFTHQGKSGKDLNRYFCKTCKAPVYLYVEKYDENYIYAGLFDEIDDLKLSKNMNFKDSHFPFLDIKEESVKT